MVLPGDVPGQGDEKDRGLEDQRADDGRACRRGLKERIEARIDKTRRHCPHGPELAIRIGRIPAAARPSRAETVDERQRQLLRQRPG